MKKWIAHFKILLAFAAHILTAIAVFCVVGAGAWVLHLVRHWRSLKDLTNCATNLVLQGGGKSASTEGGLGR